MWQAIFQVGRLIGIKRYIDTKRNMDSWTDGWMDGWGEGEKGKYVDD